MSLEGRAWYNRRDGKASISVAIEFPLRLSPTGVKFRRFIRDEMALCGVKMLMEPHRGTRAEQREARNIESIEINGRRVSHET